MGTRAQTLQLRRLVVLTVLSKFSASSGKTTHIMMAHRGNDSEHEYASN